MNQPLDMIIRCIYTNDMLLTDRNHASNISNAKRTDDISSSSPEKSPDSEAFSDNRIHIKQGRQTVRITVTITTEQHQHLRSLADSSGLNASELVRYALLQLFRNPCIFLSGENAGDG